MDELKKKLNKYNLVWGNHDNCNFTEIVKQNNPEYICNINHNLLDDCCILANKEINKKIKIKDEDEEDYYYLLQNKKTKELYISISESAPCYWHKVSEDNIKDILDIYNVSEYKIDMVSYHRAFIGTAEMLHLDMKNIEDALILCKNSEAYVWGSEWDDYPFDRTTISKGDILSNNLEMIYKTEQAIRQISDDYYSIASRTMFSKSIITIIDYNGIYIADIIYNPTPNNESINKINSTLNTNYPLDMPIDILMVLNTYPYIDHINILNIDEITETNLLITTLICADDKNKLEEIKKILEPLKKHEDNDISDICTNICK